MTRNRSLCPMYIHFLSNLKLWNLSILFFFWTYTFLPLMILLLPLPLPCIWYNFTSLSWYGMGTWTNTLMCHVLRWIWVINWERAAILYQYLNNDQPADRSFLIVPHRTNQELSTKKFQKHNRTSLKRSLIILAKWATAGTSHMSRQHP